MRNRINNYDEKINSREWHPKFIKYTELIVSHQNYQGLYYERAEDGRVKWVVAGNSESGSLRKSWWNQKCKEYGIEIKAGCYAEIARRIHPTKIHVCQICGRELSIYYVYPTKRLLSKINLIAKKNDLGEFAYADKDIYEIINILYSRNPNLLKEIRSLFSIPPNINDTPEEFNNYIRHNYVDACNRILSPGVMSNCPDRFDGFHSDGLCCRSRSDKGRIRENLMKYGEDRRAYELWSSGDWKMSSWLMKEYSKTKMKCLSCGKYDYCTADHIGPLSCGFAHSRFFNPLCRSCNSSKNNRMSINDVKTLLQIEKTEPVVSWHTEYIWNRIKKVPSTDSEAIRISNLMRENLHNILILFAKLFEAGFIYYLLRFLNPNYALYKHEFIKDDLSNMPYNIITSKANRAENKRNAIRYIRISFESLKKYSSKENRKIRYNIVESDIEIKKKILDLINFLDNIYPNKLYSINLLIKQISDEMAKLQAWDDLVFYLNRLKNGPLCVETADIKLIEIIKLIGDKVIHAFGISEA